MIVLKILGILFAAIILLVIVVLSLPIGMIIHCDKEGGPKVCFRMLGKVFGQEKGKTESPLAAALKKIVGVSHLESKEKLKSTLQDTGFADTLTGTISTLKLLLDRIFWLLPRAHVKKLHVISISAGEDAADAALHYGTVCAILYPLLSYLQTHLRVRKKALNTQISCDFDAPASVFELDIEISLRVFLMLRALWHIVKEQTLNQAEKQSKNITEVPHESK